MAVAESIVGWTDLDGDHVVADPASEPRLGASVLRCDVIAGAQGWVRDGLSMSGAPRPG